ncbi:MAG: PDDEXK nuclease domain-containing protein [Chitinophagales bacterium]|nr:PDDEXK nuclease domain-containing protein [Chitinophagales bacterium]
MKKLSIQNQLYQSIRDLLVKAKDAAAYSVNQLLVITNFQIGKLIIEYEQKGNVRAEYSDQTLIQLSKKLSAQFGNGFSVDNLERMRRFYLMYKNSATVLRNSKNNLQKTGIQKSATVLRILSWSHYLFLMRIENDSERMFYEIESSKENWSLRELQRQYDTGLFERLSLSKNKKKIKQLSKRGQVIVRPEDVIKDPYILEFLNLPEHHSYSAQEFETASISKLEDFLLELGKGFFFVGRQVRITISEDHYYIDLVFFHRFLKCFVLIDLKIGELKHKDIGQMKMYVNYYDEEIKSKNENKTIGIILCKSKKDLLVKYTLDKTDKQIFVSKYKLYIPI